MPQGAIAGIRVCLSASLPSDAQPDEVSALAGFVLHLGKAVFREGGFLVHGSHPTIVPILKKLGEEYASRGGIRDRLMLVRSAHFCTPQWQSQIEDHERFARVQKIPAKNDSSGGEAPPAIEDLLPMRDWMADRCDVVVALGGDRWQSDKNGAGIPFEIDAFLERGKPAFVVTAFGLAAQGYAEEDSSLFGRLNNGLDSEANRKLASQPSDQTQVVPVVNDIVKQIGLLPLIKIHAARHARWPTSADGISSPPAAPFSVGTRPRPLAMRDTFRILCLDGGGIRGAFTAAVLAKWASMLPKGNGQERFVDHFDLIAGTSTGSILAAGLSMGLTPVQLVDLYKTHAHAIFPATPGVKIWVTRKYDSAPLKSVLDGYLGSNVLDNAKRPLVIPTVAAKRGEAVVVTTPHSPDRTAHRGMRAVDAILASAAAPTYFDPAFVEGPLATEAFLDGGLWANNPALPAIMEALRYLEAPADRIDVLSVGTMATEKDFGDTLGRGYAQWALKVTDLFFAAQETAALEMAQMFLGNARWARVSDFSNDLPDLDAASAIPYLIERGQRVGEQKFAEIRSRFLDGSVAPPWTRF